MLVIKRDGSRKAFDRKKIEIAIIKAMKYGSGIINKEIAKKISIEIEDKLLECSTEDYNLVTRDLIEKMVYDKLIENNCTDVAIEYERYRSVQEFKKHINTTDNSIIGLLEKTNDEVGNENSNKNSALASTQRDLIAGEVSKDIARRKKIPTRITQAHDEGIIHYHDLDYAMQDIHNCCLINLEDMLQNGTVINNKLVEKPKSFSTACTITTQIIAQISSGQYGGQSMTIKHLAPFLRISYNKYYKKYLRMTNDDTISEKLASDRMMEELKAGIQTIRYQLSTLMTSNGQNPFSTIYLEVEEGNEYETEMALICEEMLKQRIEGMKSSSGHTIGEEFPKLVYLLDEHNCLEGGKYDYLTKIAAECSAKRLVPDYQSAKIMRMNYEGNTFPPIKFVA